MMSVYPLKYLLDLAIKELIERPPHTINYITYSFDDGSEHSVEWDTYRKTMAKQKAPHIFIHAIENNEITLVDSFGARALDIQDTLRAIKTYGVSHDDALKLMLFCGVAPETSKKMLRQQPAEIVKGGRALGMSDKEIAAQIDSVWTNDDRLTNQELGVVLRGGPYSEDADKKKGRHARGKTS